MKVAVLSSSSLATLEIVEWLSKQNVEILPQGVGEEEQMRKELETEPIAEIIIMTLRWPIVVTGYLD